MSRLTERARNDNDDPITAIANAIERAIDNRPDSFTFGTCERRALEVTNEAVRIVLERALQRLADADPLVVHHDVGVYKRHEPATVKYHSLCGPLMVRRWTFRRMGERNGPTIVPLELRAGLMENATPALAYAVAHGYAKAPMRTVEADMRAAGRTPPSRSTLERMATAIGTDAKKCLMEVERRVRAAERLPDGATGISIGMDRTTIPMEEALEETSPSAKSSVVVRYRMGYVGTVAITDAEGEVLKIVRYAVPAHEGGESVARRIMNDVRHALKQNPDIHIGVVQDGAPELWNLVREAFHEAGIAKARYHEVIDIFHLFERIAKGLELVEPNEEIRRAQLARWKKRMLHDDGTIARIANYFEVMVPSMKATWKRHPGRWNDRQHAQLDDLFGGYLLYAEHFRYTKMLERGLPIGSGITEGACKSLIAERAKRSGQRWRKQGISAVMTLRSLVKSDRFDAFWNQFVRRYSPLAPAA